MSLQSIDLQSDLSPNDLEKIKSSVDSLNSTIQEIRSTIFVLQDELLILNTRTLVLSEIASLSHTAGIQITHSFVGPVDTVIGQELTEQIIPVIRELITNAIKHAEASEIDLVLLANQTYCEIRVVDNGKGYVAGARKSGLLNLERRAIARGGEFEILKNVNSGTRTMWRASL
jgi:signal transduction histidine kinase